MSNEPRPQRKGKPRRPPRLVIKRVRSRTSEDYHKRELVLPPGTRMKTPEQLGFRFGKEGTVSRPRRKERREELGPLEESPIPIVLSNMTAAERREYHVAVSVGREYASLFDVSATIKRIHNTFRQKELHELSPAEKSELKTQLIQLARVGFGARKDTKRSAAKQLLTAAELLEKNNQIAFLQSLAGAWGNIIERLSGLNQKIPRVVRTLHSLKNHVRKIQREKRARIDELEKIATQLKAGSVTPSDGKKMAAYFETKRKTLIAQHDEDTETFSRIERAYGNIVTALRKNSFRAASVELSRAVGWVYAHFGRDHVLTSAQLRKVSSIEPASRKLTVRRQVDLLGQNIEYWSEISSTEWMSPWLGTLYSVAARDPSLRPLATRLLRARALVKQRDFAAVAKTLNGQ